MKIITMAVIKGGTGKTTTAAALAQAAAADGKRVLAIDLDPQANLTDFLGADQNKPGAYELLTGQADAKSIIQKTEQKIDVISGNTNLSAIKTRQGSAERLKRGLAPIKGYSFIFIDTPPALGDLTYNALYASDGLLIPLETDTSSLQGFYKIVYIAQQMQNVNKNLSILGMVLTRCDTRPKLNRLLIDTFRAKGEEYGAPLLKTIRPGIAIREATATGQSIFDYAPDSNPAKDYKELYEIIRR